MEEQEQSEIKYHCDMVNGITLGEIGLSSPFMSMEQLLEFLKKMLKDEDIKKYLGLLKSKKNSADYLG